MLSINQPVSAVQLLGLDVTRLSKAAERSVDATAQVAASALDGDHFAMMHTSGVMSAWTADVPLVRYAGGPDDNATSLLAALNYNLLNDVPLTVVLYRGDAYHLPSYVIPPPPPILASDSRTC